MKKTAIIIILIALTGFVAWAAIRVFLPEATLPVEPGKTVQEAGDGPESESEEGPDIEIVAKNLNIPWGIEFLPGGDFLITERPGVLKRTGSVNMQYNIAQVHHEGEGGLLGIALHPDFENNRYLYLYLTVSEGGSASNRVERYVYTEEGELTNKDIILQDIPGARFHNGGRIAFGPDGYLYITTGDALQPNLAQDTNSIAGKILRVRDDGSAVADNPFGNEVYSYGHRNPQGIAWDDSGRLWATEHGPTARDELNLIEAGKNYGWPSITGNQTAPGIEAPVAQSGSSTWAPSGAAYHDNSIFFAGLRGGSLYEAVIANGAFGELIAHFNGEYGRIRNAKMGPDGRLYLLTSNTDGRGTPASEDDRAIRVNPELFD